MSQGELVLDVKLAAASGEQIATPVLEGELRPPDKTILAVAGPLPPFESPVEIPSRVVDDEALTSLIAPANADRCFKVPAAVAPQSIRPEVKPYGEQRRTARVQPSR